MSKKPSEVTIEGMKKIILKSGYLLEIDVADALRKNGWSVFSQYPYMDQKTGKVRLLDILAMKRVSKRFGVSLLIECKKATRHGWAFSSVGKSKMEVQVPLARLDYLVGKLQEFIDLPAVLEDVDRIDGFHPMKVETRVGTSCCIPPGHKDDFHEAVLQLLNSIRSVRDRMVTQMTFPIIVFDGPMWEFYRDAGELKVKEIEYLQYLSAMLNEGMKGPILIDIVRFPFLPDFLNLVDSSVQWLRKAPKKRKK